MTYQCERCGQTALETDTVCWHCGWRFRPREAGKPAPKAKVVADKEQQTLPLAAIALYTALTLVTLVAIVLVTRSLAQKPFFVTHPEIPLQPGWVPITDHEQRFTLNLPSQWRWFEKQNEEQQAIFEGLAESDQFHAAVAPLANIAADTEVLFIAVSNTAADSTAPPGFLVVARSVDYRQLSSEQALNLVSQNARNLLNAEVTESFTGQEQVNLLLDAGGDNTSFRCQERLVQGQQAGYLVASCTPQAGFSRYRDELETMVASFQALTR